MNTQDERKAFIEWATSKDLNVDHEIWYNGSAKFYDEKTQSSWEAWSEQSKKLEGCVVVPVEPTAKIIRAMQQSKKQFCKASAQLMYSAIVEAARGGNE